MTQSGPSVEKAAAFGKVFASHMSLSWCTKGAWSAPEVTVTAPIPLHPAAHALHYASSCFEGLKVYRGPSGQVHIFRLQQHAERLRRSAQLLCLPVPSAANVSEAIVNLVRQLRDQVPENPGSLYLRPMLFGTEANIGAAASPSQDACFCVLASPVGDYFSGGARALRLAIEDRAMRATPEFGMAKAGANYASALKHIESAKRNYAADQVLFCPGGDVQETGASNFLLLREGELLTKPLDSGYLHGVTRDSILVLARDLGYRVVERNFTVDELLGWVRQEGEAALSGTAAVLAGVGELVYRGEHIMIGTGAVGPITQRLREALVAIQLGTAEDCYGWRLDV